MTSHDVQRQPLSSAAAFTALSTNQTAGQPIDYQAGYTDSYHLMRLHSFLQQVLGPQGAALLMERSRSLCGWRASSAALVQRLQGLSADLLGEPLARLGTLQAQLHHPFALPEQQVSLLQRANEQLALTALHAQAATEAALARLDQLTHTSQRDALTNTPNRGLLLDRLESALTMAQRRYSRCAVLFLDIDHFKQINDTLGHATGDAVLQGVAARLQAAVRDSDAVGRHGGDEFLVLLAEVSKMADVAQIARKIISDIGQPSLVHGHMLHVGVSVGIAIYPDDALEAASLIGHADTAMYRSKRRGGASFSFFSEQQGSVDAADAQA